MLSAALVLLLLQTPSPMNDALLEAARTGNSTQVAAALDAGASVDARGRYDITPLITAAMNGHVEVVRLLLSRGASVNLQDSFYRARAIDMALTNGHTAVATLLLERDSAGAATALPIGVEKGDLALVRQALKATLPRPVLQAALASPAAAKSPDILAALKEALGTLSPEPATPEVTVPPGTLAGYAGSYRDAASGLSITISAAGSALTAQVQGQPAIPLVARSQNSFGSPLVPNLTISFETSTGPSPSLTVVQGPANVTLARTDATAPAAPATPVAAAATPAAPASPAAPALTAARNWPSFRGDAASGNGDGQGAVSDWDVTSGRNIKWKTAIPGISTASPIVWADRVFITTAISKAGDATFRTGQYGDVKPVDDLSEHQWKLYCLDRTTGKVLWERSAVTGAPKTKRHTKSSQSNSTPVTDGQRVIAAFGSAGMLVAWDMSGRELWRVDLGTVDSGWFFDASYQWGHASSPIIFRDTVILQVDQQKGSYVAAWNIATGKQAWKTMRAGEVSTWGTPTLLTSDGRTELITNGTKVRGYDPATGTELWTLGPNSEITVATPVTGHGLAFVTAGYAPVRPIYAIRSGARGDITLAAGQTSSEAIAWSNTTEGTYIPTPIVYGDYLFTLNNNGVVSAYDAKTGKSAFRGRVGVGGAFSASLVAADGRLYVSNEDGDVHVVAAAPGLSSIARNDMKEVIMATPAISNGLLFVRTLGHVYAIGK